MAEDSKIVLEFENTVEMRNVLKDLAAVARQRATALDAVTLPIQSKIIEDCNKAYREFDRQVQNIKK